jgi:single-strand DNA-binding protein
MPSVNKVFILGNVGNAPEMRYTSNGTATCKLSVATDRSWANKDSGEKTEETEWHTCVAWAKTAEICGEYVQKGDKIHIEGRLKTRSWDKDGVKHYATEIIVESVILLFRREKSVGGGKPKEERPRGKKSDSDDDGPAF